MAMDVVSVELKEQRNTTLLAATQHRRDNFLLSAQNECLKEEAAKFFEIAKEAMTEVIKTSKAQALSAFGMLVDPKDVLTFNVACFFKRIFIERRCWPKNPPTLVDSSDEEDDEEEHPLDNQENPQDSLSAEIHPLLNRELSYRLSFCCIVAECQCSLVFSLIRINEQRLCFQTVLLSLKLSLSNKFFLVLTS